MRINRIILKMVFPIVCVGLISSEGFSQNPSTKIVNAVKNYSKKNQKKENVSMQMLKSATKIKYGFNNGSVAPEYQYQGTIIVTPNYVTLNITNMSSLCYTETRNLTTSQYSSFLNRLYGLGIKLNPDEPMMLCGGGVYDILIQKGNSTLFKGVEDEDIVTTKGNLSDAFVPLLNSKMREVYNDPSSTFGMIIDIFPEDQTY